MRDQLQQLSTSQLFALSLSTQYSTLIPMHQTDIPTFEVNLEKKKNKNDFLARAVDKHNS